MRNLTLGYASNHLHFLLTFFHRGTSNEQSHPGFLPITQNDTGRPPIK